MNRLPKETPELQLEYARSFMVEGEFKNALRETNKFNEFYEDSTVADENQFLRGEIKLAQKQHLEAARDYQQVVVNFPESDLFDEVIGRQYQIGDTLFEIGKRRIELRQQRKWWTFRRRPFAKRPLKKAIDVYAMVIKNQPFTPEAAEAQYKIGLSRFTREEYIDAAFEYRQIIERYPTSEFVDDALHGLAQTYTEGSLAPAYDQAPTLLAIDAIDDFVQRYPADTRTPKLREDRVEMRERVAQQRLLTARFYERSEEFRASRIYYTLLVDDFGETEAAKDAQAWLDEHPAPSRLKARFLGLASSS